MPAVQRVPAPSAVRLRDAAFGSSPGADVFAAAGSPDPRTRWLAAVVLGGQGHYAAAAAVLGRLLGHHDPLWAALAAGTLASHRRQLGWHAGARRLDAVALRRIAGLRSAGPPDPDGVDVVGARCDALIGLAADSLGLGRLAVAERLLAAARRAGEDTDSWRTAVRLSWVRAELHLAAGNAAAAIEPARRAVERSAGAVRHAAKSRLVLAAAIGATGRRDEAVELLDRLVVTVRRHRLVSLEWPAELLLAELTDTARPGDVHRRLASTALRIALRRADGPLRAAAESSLWVPSEVLQTGDSAERSSAGEIHGEICTGLCQVSTPRDR